MRALVATVGTGATVEDGIAFSINSLNPDRVYLICTPQSTAKIPLVVQRLDAPERLAQTPLSVRDPGDFDRTYLDCCHALEQMAADGFEPALCTVDYMDAISPHLAEDHGTVRSRCSGQSSERCEGPVPRQVRDRPGSDALASVC